jgi:hypothetical protein
MKRLLLLLPHFFGITAALADDTMMVFQGACDGSGASAVNGTTFLSVSDEDNVIRLYDTNWETLVRRPVIICLSLRIRCMS